LLHAASDLVSRESRPLKTLRRQILAALSKLVLSARVASALWPPHDAAAKVLQDALDVAAAAAAYVHLAAQIPGDLKYLAPVFVKTPRAALDKANILSLDKRPLSSAIQRDLEDYAAEIKSLLKHLESIVLLRRHLFPSRLIGGVGHVALQTRKLLALLETINLDQLQSSLSLNDLLVSKQSVYDSLAALLVAAQTASLDISALDSLRSCSKDLDKSISGSIFNVQLLVGEREVSLPHRSSLAASDDDPLPTTPKRGAKLKKFFGDDAPQHVPKHKETVPWYLGHDKEGDLAYDEKGNVKGGTLAALVERLTRHDFWDSAFNNTFLLTYKSFTDVEELFQLLVTRFATTPPLGLSPSEMEIWIERKQKPIRLRVFNILKSWLESYFSESSDSPTLVEIKHFAANIMAFSIPGAGVLVKLAEKRMNTEESSIPLRKMVLNISQPLPEPIIPKNMKRIKFLDLDPLEIARQLTIIESRLYNKIAVGECLDKSWSRSNAEETAENIRAMILNSNQITGWVAEAILNQPEIKRRVNLLKQFILIAEVYPLPSPLNLEMPLIKQLFNFDGNYIRAK
ncbi:Cell division control protein 25, partial [Neolecta irregularis DAH-3]